MISLRASNYAKVLYSLGLPENKVKVALLLLKENRELQDALTNPAVKKTEKEAVIDKLFDQEVSNFIKVLCVEQCIDLVDDILEEYEIISLAKQNKIKAKLAYVTKLDDAETKQMKDMICKKYNKAGVELELLEDASLIGGFCLTVGDTEYDRSIKGTLLELEKTLVRR